MNIHMKAKTVFLKTHFQKRSHLDSRNGSLLKYIMARLTEPPQKKAVRKRKAKGFPGGKRIADLVKAKRMKAKRVFPFAWEDIAEAVKLSAVRVQNLARQGIFDPRDLKSLSTYIYLRLQKIEKSKHTKKRIQQKGEGTTTDGKA